MGGNISPIYDYYEKMYFCVSEMRKKVTGKRRDRREDFYMQRKEVKRDYGNVVLERKNFSRIILKYVLCGGRVEIVAPYP